MRIIITSGVYGERVGNDVIRRHAGDELSVSDAEGKRLIALGVAKSAVATPDKGEQADAAGVRKSETASAAESKKSGESAYGTESTVAELRAIAKSEGITFKVGMSKAAMIAALDEHFGTDSAPDLYSDGVVG